MTRLWKPGFDSYLNKASRRAILRDANAAAHWVNISESISAQRYCRDAGDNKFIHTALAASAPLLVSGDQDLLVIPAGLCVRILAPAEALQRTDFCQ